MMCSSDQYDKATGRNVRRGAGLTFRPAGGDGVVAEDLAPANGLLDVTMRLALS
jgi:hypothetical protein